MKKSVNQKLQRLCELAFEGKLPHAILLETEDIAKEGLKAAFCVAQALLCKSEFDRPCKKCSVCQKVELLAHPDVQLVSVKQGYKSIRVDDIREVKLDAYLAPNEAEYKIYIISDGSLMNESAQNVFLKVLEEPPERVKFIILCKSRFSMLPTVRSRVQVFKIGEKNRVSASSKVKSIVDDILDVCAKEGNDFDILKATAKLVKDKDVFTKVINELDYVISNLCICKAKGELHDEYAQFNSLSLKKLLKMGMNIKNIKDLIDKNINNQLAVCGLCIKIME